MRTLAIAYGGSCHAKYWSNKTITFAELCERLKTTIRTPETVEEYPNLPKAERDRVKDKGGFVGGVLRKGRRSGENVVGRSIGTLDGDNAEPEFIDIYTVTHRYASCLYTTHGHTLDAPRVRIHFPFTRDVTPDEYVAIMRYLAAELGIDQFDPCSYRPQQLMYWPTTPSNGEFVFQSFEGPWLDPDVYLAAHPNWRDCSQLPTSAKESMIVKREQTRQKDPLSKPGVVGAFCRAYSIEAAIDTFLPNVYKPSIADDRRDYVNGTSSAGLVLYDGKFAYSHHASDPASGQLLNAFELVRLHKFPPDSYNSKDAKGDEKQSFGAMADFALSLDDVKLEIAQERQEQAKTDFAVLGAQMDGSAGDANSVDSEDSENPATVIVDPDAWKAKLRYMPKTAILENSVWNEMLILNNDRDFRNFAYNELANRVQIIGPVPWERPEGNKYWRDADTAQLKAMLDVRYVAFSNRNHDVCFTKVADDRHFHPIRDYLDSLPPWDGKERIPTMLIDYLQADDTDYTRAVTKKTMTAAVARVYLPGIKFDSVLVMDGEQGIGKSTIFKDLVGEEYYSESLSLTDMDDKSAAENLQGFWIVEIGELAGMKKADIEKVKAFLSTSDDKYRPSYGKTVESHPRQCIIIGSVNGERGYLRDITGNRRFWVVKCHQTEQKKSWNFTPSDRDQIWAEAKALYEAGEKLYLEGDLIAASIDAQREAMENDDRQGLVEDYLNIPLPENWESLEISERRSYIMNNSGGKSLIGEAGTGGTKAIKRMYVSNAEIWCECLGRSLPELKPTDSYGIAALMTKMDNWTRTQERKRIPGYGMQRIYKRRK